MLISKTEITPGMKIGPTNFEAREFKGEPGKSPLECPYDKTAFAVTGVSECGHVGTRLYVVDYEGWV